MSPGARSERFIFTVATGRCGQASLTEMVQTHVTDCYAAFEEPQVHPILPPPLDTFERRFRRRFIETDELLGRGQVLRAFESGDHGYIERIAEQRLTGIRREMRRRKASTYVDASKFFARGLHVGFINRLDRLSLIHLVRDPLRNMRSFLNRGKIFSLDNSMPDSAGNLLRLDRSALEPGELYLWAWCELYLRFDEMRHLAKVTHAVEIRTEQLEDAARMNAALDSLELEHTPVVSQPPRNTNTSSGLPSTQVSGDDIRLFERFVNRLPGTVRARITYLNDYDPWSAHKKVLVGAI